jgi:membrane associated rhomboid family serine protease
MIESIQELLRNILDSALTVGLFLLVLWILYVADALLFRGSLRERFGIQPRSRFRPLSILFSPLLHVSVAHLAANSVPFFVLGTLVLIQGQTTFWLVTATIVVVGGLGVWLFGRPNTLHVGASGLILGYFGYLLASVFFAPDLATIVVAVIVAVLYLGLIWQVVPLKKGVSFTGHLFGFLAGVLAAGLVALVAGGM